MCIAYHKLYLIIINSFVHSTLIIVHNFYFSNHFLDGLDAHFSWLWFCFVDLSAKFSIFLCSANCFGVIHWELINDWMLQTLQALYTKQRIKYFSINNAMNGAYIANYWLLEYSAVFLSLEIDFFCKSVVSSKNKTDFAFWRHLQQP